MYHIIKKGLTVEKRYSIIEAFKATKNAFFVDKTEFLKLFFISVVSINLSNFYNITIKNQNLLSFPLDLLLIVVLLCSSLLVLVYVKMFLNSFKNQNVSFVASLKNIYSWTVIKKMLLFMAAIIALSIMFIISASVVVVFLVYSLRSDSLLYWFVGIASFVYMYYLSRYGFFMLQEIVSGNSLLEGARTSFALTSLKLIVKYMLILTGIILTVLIPYILILPFIKGIVPKVFILFVGSIFQAITALLFNGSITHLYLQLKDQ